MKLDEITNKAKKQSGFIYDNTNNKEIGEINPNDEYYTPNYAIAPLLKYLKPHSNIWCPFDTDDSNYVKFLTPQGFTVRNSHLHSGNDFFKSTPPPLTDYIISNPPYSLKYEVFKRLFELEKPFAMLVGIVGLFESQKRFKMFQENDFEIMYFDKRISYFKSYSDQKPSLNPPFSSVYVTKGILPKQIVFENLKKDEYNGFKYEQKLFNFEKIAVREQKKL